MRYLLLLLFIFTTLAVQAQPKRSSYTVKIENPITGEMDERTIFVPDTCFGSHNGKGQIRTVSMPAWIMAEFEELYDLMLRCKPIERDTSYSPHGIKEYLAFKLGKNKQPVYIYEVCAWEKAWAKLAGYVNEQDTIPGLYRLIHDNYFFGIIHETVTRDVMSLTYNIATEGDTISALSYLKLLKGKYTLRNHEWCGVALSGYHGTITTTTTALYHYYYNRNNIDSTIYWMYSLGLDYFKSSESISEYKENLAKFVAENGLAKMLKKEMEQSLKKLVIEKSGGNFTYSLMIRGKNYTVRGLSYYDRKSPPKMEEHINYIKENSIYQFL